jgi:hypothetical protein
MLANCHVGTQAKARLPTTAASVQNEQGGTRQPQVGDCCFAPPLLQRDTGRNLAAQDAASEQHNGHCPAQLTLIADSTMVAAAMHRLASTTCNTGSPLCHTGNTPPPRRVQWSRLDCKPPAPDRGIRPHTRAATCLPSTTPNRVHPGHTYGVPNPFGACSSRWRSQLHCPVQPTAALSRC